jgi:hypothetical protein
MRKKWVLLIIRIVATARKWAVAYVIAALPVEVALNDRKPDEAAHATPGHRMAGFCARFERMNKRLFSSAGRF